MPTRNTRAKRVARKNVKNLLVDEMAFKTNVARNLNLLAGDILSDEEKDTPQVIGVKLLKATELLSMTEHMVIAKYYGLIGPKYQPVSISAIAKEHHTSSKVITDLKNSALARLGRTCYKTLYHEKVREEATDKLMHSEMYVDLSFLYKGFKDTNTYRILRKYGITYIHELAECDADAISMWADTEKEDLRYCDLLSLKNKAQNVQLTDELLDMIAIETQDEMILQSVEDLEIQLAKDIIDALREAEINSIAEFLSLTQSEIYIAVMGNPIHIAEIVLVRDTLGFPVS